MILCFRGGVETPRTPAKRGRRRLYYQCADARFVAKVTAASAHGETLVVPVTATDRGSTSLITWAHAVYGCKFKGQHKKVGHG